MAVSSPNQASVAAVDSATVVGCGALRVKIGGAPQYDHTQRLLRLPVVVENTSNSSVSEPARLYGWEDSLIVITPPGLAKNKNTDIYLEHLNPDSVRSDTSSVWRAAKSWRLDSLLAPNGAPRTLAAGATSQVRWLDILVHPGVSVFKLTLWTGATPAVTQSHRLVVQLENGAQGTPGVLDTTLARGTTVPYAFAAQQGYENLLVWMDSAFVQPSGTIVMTSDHIVIASADSSMPLQPGDATLLAKTQAVLSASDKVTAFQDLLNEVIRSSNAIGEDATRALLERTARAAIDPVGDSARLRQVDEALAGKTFDLTLDISPPGSFRRGAFQSAMPIFAPEATTIRFVSGIFNNFDDSRKAALMLEGIVRQLPRFANAGSFPGSLRITFSWNRTFNEFQNLTNVHRCILRLARLDEGKGILSFLKEFGACTGSSVWNTLVHFDLVESAIQLGQANVATPLAQGDSKALMDSITADRDAGRHSIVVPHSQGNLMMHEAGRLLRARGLYQRAGDSTCIGTIPLASPIAAHYPVDTARLRPVQVDGDIILLTPSSHFLPTVVTQRSLQAAQDIAHWQSIAAGTLGPFKALAAPLVALRRTYWGVKLHFVDWSYLAPGGARTFVASAIDGVYAGCVASRIELTPANVSLRAGETAAFATSVFAESEAALPGWPIRWSSSNPSVASVDAQTGVVTAIGQGTALIQAATRRFAFGEAGVEVVTGPSTVPTPPIIKLAIGTRALQSSPPDAAYVWTSWLASLRAEAEATWPNTAIARYEFYVFEVAHPNSPIGACCFDGGPSATAKWGETMNGFRLSPNDDLDGRFLVRVYDTNGKMAERWGTF